MARRAAAAGVMIAVVWAGGTATQPETAVAQQRRPVVVTRVYTGADGRSHAERLDVKMVPGGDRAESSESIAVTGMRIRRTPPGYVFKGTAPRRLYVVTLSGRAEIDLADGEKVVLDRDNIVLLEDTTGQGRVLRDVGPEDRVSIQLALPDQ
jgi:hypothetical protein